MNEAETSEFVTHKEYTDRELKDLKEYTDRRFDDQYIAVKAALASAEKAVNAALIAAKEAVTKANDADEKHFELINNRNQEIDKLTATFVPRSEEDLKFGVLSKDVEDLKKIHDNSAGVVTGISKTWAVTVTIIGILFTAISLGYAFYSSLRAVSNSVKTISDVLSWAPPYTIVSAR